MFARASAVSLLAMAACAAPLGCRHSSTDATPVPSVASGAATASAAPAASVSAPAPTASAPAPPTLPSARLTFTTPPPTVRFRSTSKLHIDSEPDDEHPVGYSSGKAKIWLEYSRQGAPPTKVELEEIGLSSHGANGDGQVMIAYDADGMVVQSYGGKEAKAGARGMPEDKFVLAHRPPNTVATSEVGFMSERMWSRYYVYDVVRVAEKRYTIIRRVWQTDQEAPVEDEPLTKVRDFDEP